MVFTEGFTSTYLKIEGFLLSDFLIEVGTCNVKQNFHNILSIRVMLLMHSLHLFMLVNYCVYICLCR